MSEASVRKFDRQVLHDGECYLISRYCFKHVKKWIFLVLPEDTTPHAAVQPYQKPASGSNRMFGIIKTVLWIVIPICLSLLIGQLK